jgi:chorismate-pyruvate lyase
MNLNECAKESAVLAALANDSMTEELQAHFESCAVCQEAKLVSSYLGEAASAGIESEIPPAGIIWWRAQLAKKRIEARRSVAVIEAMQKIAVALAAAVMVAIAAWQGPKLLEMRPLLLAGSLAVVILFLASLAVVLNSDRATQRRALPRGM